MLKYAIYVGGVVLGSGLGYLVYKFIGCRSGACPITSNPWLSMLMGALFVFAIVSNYMDKIVK